MSEKQNTIPEEELDKLDLFYLIYLMWKSFKRNFIAVCAIILVCTLGSLFLAISQYTPTYQAYTSFVVGAGNAYNSSYYDSSTAKQLEKTFSYIVSSGVLRDVVAKDLEIPAVTSGITASVTQDTNLFTISVTDGDPQMAYNVLQSVIENYPKVAEYIIGSTKLTVIDESGVPSAPMNQRNATKKAIFGAALGMVLAFGLLLVQSVRNKTIQRPEQLKKMMSAKSLGNLPFVPVKKRSNMKRQVVKIDNPRVPYHYKEAMRVLRSRVERAMEKGEASVLMVTSAIPGEGKSTVAANLALALAGKGRKVVLIDGDFRHPSVADALGIEPPEYGFTDFLKEGGKISKIMQTYGETTLKVIAGNKPVNNPLPYISSKQMRIMIEKLKETNDYVIIDTPPCAMISDAAAYVNIAEQAMLVVRQDYTEQKQIRKALEMIADANIPVAGYVLNGTDESIGGYGNYNGYGYRQYGYGYGYGQGKDEKTKKKKG